MNGLSWGRVAGVVLLGIGACGGAIAVDDRDASPCSPGVQSSCTCSTSRGAGVRSCDGAGRWTSCACSGAEPPPPQSEPTLPGKPAPPADDPPGDVSRCAGEASVLIEYSADLPASDRYYRTITGTPTDMSTPPDSIGFTYLRPNSDYYRLTMDTRRLGRSLALGMYPDADDPYSSTPNKAGFTLNVNGGNPVGTTTTFWIRELEWNGNKLTRLLVAFDETFGPNDHDRGCMAYRADPDVDGGM